MGAVRRYWLHGLPRIVVVFITTGTLTVGLFLFFNLLSLLAVDEVPAANLLVGVGLDQACQSPEQSE